MWSNPEVEPDRADTVCGVMEAETVSGGSLANEKFTYQAANDTGGTQREQQGVEGAIDV